MTFEQAKQELTSEPVASGLMEQTIGFAMNAPKRKAPSVLRRGLPFALGLCVVTGFAIFPWRKGDQLLAQAKTGLFESKYIHIFTKGSWRHGDSEIWIHGADVVETRQMRLGIRETASVLRRSHSINSVTTGQVTGIETDGEFLVSRMDGYRAFDAARMVIANGNAKRDRKMLDGKSYITFRFRSGGQGFASNPNDPGYAVADTFLTAFVDEESSKIVRIQQRTEANPRLAEYKKHHAFTLNDNWIHEDDMDATIEYPPTMNESLFDTPKDAFEIKSRKNVIAQLLASNTRTATIKGRKITLHGVLFDGFSLNVIWSGVPADYRVDDRFRISEVKLEGKQDVRCLSSSKVMNSVSKLVLYCQQGAEAMSQVPKTVTITIPVFTPDQSRPFQEKKGFHSKKIGEVTFKNVPVTPCQSINFYERQFGLLNHWW